MLLLYDGNNICMLICHWQSSSLDFCQANGLVSFIPNGQQSVVLSFDLKLNKKENGVSFVIVAAKLIIACQCILF